MADHIQIGDISPRIQYTGDGSQTAFTYPFPIFEDADIEVYLDEAIQTITTDYSVSGTGEDNGGTVTFLTAPAASETVTLVRNLTVKRESDFQESGEFRAKVINDELDKIIAMLQEVEDQLGRGLFLSETDTANSLKLPGVAERANAVLAFDANGDPVAAVDPGSYPASAFMGTLLDDADAATARSTLGLGDAATGTIGTDVLAPSGDGSSLTGITAGQVSGLLSGADIRLAFLMIAENAGNRLNMVDGIADPFMDETDVDTATSTNETYDAAGDYYHSRDEVDKFTGGTGSVSTGSATNVFDGNTGTEWNSTSAAPQWAKYDLGASNEVALTRLRVFNGTNATYDRVNAFTFAGSNDDSAWTTLHTDSIADTGGNPAWEEFDFTNATTYRYYRFTIDSTHGGTTAGVAELEGLALNPQNITLVSDAFTADSAPDTGRVHVQVMENEAITVNTDLTAEISRDGGTTWTTATLVLQETLADGTRAYEDDDLDISAQPSGTSMKYRIKTLNNKDIEIHGVVLQWA